MSDKHLTWEEAVLWLRSQPEKQTMVLACFYDDPVSIAAERYFSSTEWRAVRQFLPSPPGKALDIGAGRGISSFALARGGWRVTALEPDPSMVVGSGSIRTLVRETNVPIHVVETWGERLPFPDCSFDLVHARAVLHHSKDLEALCGEAARVLKPNGTFLALREHVISRRADVDSFRKKHPLHHLYGGENAFTLMGYRSAMQKAGLIIEHLLNPFATNINLFPRTLDDLKLIVGLRIIPPVLLPDVLLRMLGAVYSVPGRLYSFVARKAVK